MTDSIKLPPDATPEEWRNAVWKVWKLAREKNHTVPSHWLDAMRDLALKAAWLNADPEPRGVPRRFAGWLVSDSEGDDEFINNPTALHGRHYKGGAPLLLQVASTAEPRGNAEVAHHPV